MSGTVDKAAFGKFGLVHAVQELYGNAAAGRLLSAFSRLFTAYCQWHGFTCGFDDLLLVQAAEDKRKVGGVCLGGQVGGPPQKGSSFGVSGGGSRVPSARVGG